MEEQKPERNEKGHFIAGNKAAKGNPYAKKIHEFKARLFEAVTANDIDQIVFRAIEDAKSGCRHSREWLFDRLLGKATQPIEASVETHSLTAEEVKAKIDSMLGLTVSETVQEKNED